jgi:hypothetical protein
MGQEIECRMGLGSRSLHGKAYLESDYLLFRGEERVKLPFKDFTSVKASSGTLLLEFAGGPAELELGPVALKWARHIQHPPSRAAKLGVKPGLIVRVAGEFPEDFTREIAGLPPAGSRSKADLIFFLAPTRQSLDRIRQLATGLKPAGALWVVYPKGVTGIRESEVLEAGRAAGLKDVKVVSFSPTHTALRFVIPIDSR